MTKAKHAGGRPRRAEDRYTDSHGYVQRRVGDVWIPEHRLVMMAILGRELVKGEQVRHRNGVRDDNAPGNLEVWVGQLGRATEVICPNCLLPWNDLEPGSLAVSIADAEEMLRTGAWSAVETSPRGVSGTSEKLAGVPVLLRHGRGRSRRSVSPEQFTIFDALAETAA